jgi:hypothetical protein
MSCRPDTLSLEGGSSKTSTRTEIRACLQGECSYRCAEENEEEIQRRWSARSQYPPMENKLSSRDQSMPSWMMLIQVRGGGEGGGGGD